MVQTGLPFDDIRALAADLPQADEDAANHTKNQLTGETGIYADLCIWYSRWSGRSPSINRPLVTLFAGTHAVENSLDGGDHSAWVLNEVTGIASGESPVNRICSMQDVGLKVFDLALQIPVEDITDEAAFDERSCAGTIAFGMEAIAGGTDLLCLSSVSKGPTTSCLAVLSLANGVDGEEWKQITSPDQQEAICKAVNIHKAHQSDPLEILRRVGGRETAALCGAILSARSQHVPVLLDGWDALAAASILYKLNPGAVDHCRFGQNGFTDLGNVSLQKMGQVPLVHSPLSDNPAHAIPMAAGMMKAACSIVQSQS